MPSPNSGRSGLSRRAFIGGAAMAVAGSQFPNPAPLPDRVTAFLVNETLDLKRTGTSWQARDVVVSIEPRSRLLTVALAAPQSAVLRVRLRWRTPARPGWRYLGDHWERSYGDLEWRALSGERVMPWYFLATDGKATHGWGVKTGAAAICFWQVDSSGVTLWLDVRNGGEGVRLGERQLEAATVVAFDGGEGVPVFQAAQAFCRAMCHRPRLPRAPVYGWNNWYYTYGKGFSSADILRDSELVASMAPTGISNRPFMLIDEGWGVADDGAGPWNRGNERFPDMPALAGRMKAAGVRPGIWMRPLLTADKLPESWRLPRRPAGRYFLIDPSVPEALEHLRRAVGGIASWGFEMIKHDYSTYDILGRWGFQMGADLTNAGWHFADHTRTTAEIVLELYRAIREAAGDALLIGCNTIGHLGAGLFELQRIGDDNSGKDWHRTRRMGVNTLAFRMPQHNAFFAADADCVPMTAQVPWKMTRQWLDLLARSGTPLFVSADPASLGAEQRAAIRSALAAAAVPQPVAEPLDWMESTAPERWLLNGKVTRYDWYGDEGASPFSR